MNAEFNRRRFLRSAPFALSLPALLAACSNSGLGQAIDRSFLDPDLFDPTDVRGVALPEGYFRSWGRDVIAPIYEPTYVDASGVDWRDEEVVIGININGQQRAYPVGFMSNRELVIEQIDELPLMVTW